jgi:hypothetical protein
MSEICNISLTADTFTLHVFVIVCELTVHNALSNQFTHGHVSSWTVASLQSSPGVCEWFADMNLPSN